MSKHILVTGGAGFIGSHLTRRLLSRGDRVTVLDDFNDFYDPERKRRNVAPLLERPDYRLVEGDIRDEARVDRLFSQGKFDGVVHLAGEPSAALSGECNRNRTRSLGRLESSNHILAVAGGRDADRHIPRSTERLDLAGE